MLEIPAELAGVQTVVAGALSRVEGTIRGALASEIAPVQRLVEHVEAYHGKMIRPTLVSLCGLAVAGRADEGALAPAHITLGAVVEMVHLATLVHDDVLDEADQRRMTETVNRLRGNEAAVMLGDYLFSAAYRLCGQLGDAHATVRIGQTGMTLCAGELLQLDNRGNFSLDEATYYALIDRKTASLISVSCELGARASGADEALATRLARFGTSLGLAFQIQDDLLDLAGDQRLVGKSLGKDAEKGKLTLPVIHHLAMADATARGRTLRLLRDGPVGATPWAEARAELARAVESTGSITHSRREAQRLVDEAKSHLASLKPSPARALMEAMADAVVTRAF
jgi:octaprenyl-diphosphate synthase